MTKDIEKFKEMWYSRNPVHENNLDTGKDMFWETAESVSREYVEYITQQPLSGSDDKSSSPKVCPTCKGFGKVLRGVNDKPLTTCPDCGQTFR